MNKKEIKNLIELLDKGSNRRTATYNKLMLKNYKEALIYTRQELQKLFNKLGDTPTYSEASVRLNNIEYQLVERINELNKNTTKLIKKSVQDNYEFNYNGFNKILGKSIPTDITFGLI